MLKTEESVKGQVAPESKLIKLEKILVGTDFSIASERALEYALGLARRYESQIYLVHVITGDAEVMLAPEMIVATHERAVRDAQEGMGQVLISGRMRGVTHEMLIEQGALWPTMQRLIEKLGIDLVIVGTNGAGSLQRILIGSSAEEIFRQAKCPVLTVGPAVQGEMPRDAEFKNILFATDFGVGAEREAAYAFSLGQEHQANLTLLHVVTHADDYSEQGLALKKEAITNELGELVPVGGELWCKLEFRMRLGEPVEEILEVAQEIKADLIVMGAKRGSGFTAGHVPRTVAYRVVCGAPCPVLTVRF